MSQSKKESGALERALSLGVTEMPGTDLQGAKKYLQGAKKTFTGGKKFSSISKPTITIIKTI